MSDLKRAGTAGTPVSGTKTITRSSSSRQGVDTRGSASSGKSDDFVDAPMLEAKLNRKRAEGDLQLLANRCGFYLIAVTYLRIS